MGRISGTFYLKINNKLLHASGEFSFSQGIPKREAVLSSNSHVGYREEQTTAFVEGDLIDKDINHTELFNTVDATITLELANGKTFVLSNAYCCGDTKASTDGKIAGIRFEGSKGEII